MSNFVLSCCSVVDLTPEYMKERNISYACFHYTMDGVDHFDDMGLSMSHADFYKAVGGGADVHTSQVNVEEYTRYFEGFLKDGMDVLHLTLSSGLSGSYNSARIAAEMLQEQYPDRKLYVVDSLAASSGGGLLVDTLADMRDDGADIDTLRDWAEAHKLEMHHWFTASDLTQFIKGGRVTKAAGWFGTVLKICPVLNVDNLGRLIPRFKIRGVQNSLKELVNQMIEHAQNGTDYNGKCFICNSACEDNARFVADEIEKRFPHLNGKVQIYSIGTTIGCHTGPGTTAVFFWGDKRVN
ncbi:MAG: DegV family protein [Clostridia bacterium]|nr:DegV family protein [Clostridia bacterium]